MLVVIYLYILYTYMYVYDEHDSTFISFRKTMVALSRYLDNSKMLFG